MDKKIMSAMYSGLFHQQALAHIRIVQAKWNDKGAITTITHPNATT
jgi:hypothetical protein